MKLADSFSLFLYAFKTEATELNKADSMWKRSGLEPEKNFYFRHVQDFFIKNNGDDTAITDESCCLGYELDSNKLSDAQKDKLGLITQLLSRPSQTYDKKEKPIQFKLCTDKSILSPRILYNPLTGIGILSFGFVLMKEDNTLENLINLNYKLRVFGRGDSGDFSIARNEHPAAQEQENKLAEKLSQFYTGGKNEAGTEHNWNVNTLVNILMQEIPTGKVNILSPNRLQAFTYAQLEQKLDEEELQIASFRLRHVYNLNYTPGRAYINKAIESEQMFEQIHFGASIEGCAVIVNEDADKLPAFLKDYDLVVKNRYIWTYFLAYYQRLALIEMDEQLSYLYDEGQPKKEKLLKASSNLSKIELRTFFMQVSYFSQHNDFFDFCRNNLKLGEMFSNIKDKLADISRILQEHMEEEEKEREKKREKKDRILEVMIAMLLIPEIVFEFLSMLAHVFEINFPLEHHTILTYGLFVFSSLLMITLIPFAIRIYKEYYLAARSYLKKEDLPHDAGFKKGGVDKAGW
ncbi:MAG: hypothetical protein BGO69_16940 [Bacteroidetes bacterium 46-16]|nr:MAG: hypothetical protein BGO69_16940 [Bacteroidetes bacterium 46-16]